MNKYQLNIDEVNTLIKNGLNSTELSLHYKCSKSWIYTFCKQNNIKFPEKENFVGKSWDYLTVISQSKNDKHQKRCWICKCKCGKEVLLSSTSVKKQHTKSCGCWNYIHRKQRKNWTGYKEIHGKLWGQIKRNAKKRNLEFNISLKYIWNLYLKQQKKCSLSGQKIIFSDTIKNFSLGLNTASLDRIDNTKGYIKGNVQWIHKDVNWMKQDFEQKYFIEICKKIAIKNK